MSKKLKKELENLAEIVRRHLDGISIEELLKFMNNVTPRRTVQYRLSLLIKSGILRIEGAGRNTGNLHEKFRILLTRNSL